MILTGSFGVPAGNAEKLIIPTIKRITAREYANLTSFFELIIKAFAPLSFWSLVYGLWFVDRHSYIVLRSSMFCFLFLCAWFVSVKYFSIEALLLRDSDLECSTLSNSGLKGLDRALILLYWK